MIISYLKYRRKAQGKYHLHSPLVFDLYEKVLEPSMSFRAKRNRVKCSREILHERKQQVNDEFYDDLNNRIKDFVNDNSLIFKDNDVVMIVKDIHRNRQNEADWERLKDDEKVRLSIDCWRFGMVFIMDRIKKEHYILKI